MGLAAGGTEGIGLAVHGRVAVLHQAIAARADQRAVGAKNGAAHGNAPFLQAHASLFKRNGEHSVRVQGNLHAVQSLALAKRLTQRKGASRLSASFGSLFSEDRATGEVYPLASRRSRSGNRSRSEAAAFRIAASGAGSPGDAGAIDFHDGADSHSDADGSAGVRDRRQRDLAFLRGRDGLHAAGGSVHRAIRARIRIAGIALLVCDVVTPFDGWKRGRLGAVARLRGYGRVGGRRIRALRERGARRISGKGSAGLDSGRVRRAMVNLDALPGRKSVGAADGLYRSRVRGAHQLRICPAAVAAWAAFRSDPAEADGREFFRRAARNGLGDVQLRGI